MGLTEKLQRNWKERIKEDRWASEGRLSAQNVRRAKWLLFGEDDMEDEKCKTSLGDLREVSMS